MVFLPSVPGIYAITFTATGEQYVGASRNVGARVRAHFRSLQGQPSPWVSRLAKRIAASEGVTVGQALGRIDGALDAELVIEGKNGEERRRGHLVLVEHR